MYTKFLEYVKIVKQFWAENNHQFRFLYSIYICSILTIYAVNVMFLIVILKWTAFDTDYFFISIKNPTFCAIWSMYLPESTTLYSSFYTVFLSTLFGIQYFLYVLATITMAHWLNAEEEAEAHGVIAVFKIRPLIFMFFIAMCSVAVCSILVKLILWNEPIIFQSFQLIPYMPDYVKIQVFFELRNTYIINFQSYLFATVDFNQVRPLLVHVYSVDEITTILQQFFNDFATSNGLEQVNTQSLDSLHPDKTASEDAVLRVNLISSELVNNAETDSITGFQKILGITIGIFSICAIIYFFNFPTPPDCGSAASIIGAASATLAVNYPQIIERPAGVFSGGGLFDPLFNNTCLTAVPIDLSLVQSMDMLSLMLVYSFFNFLGIIWKFVPPFGYINNNILAAPNTDVMPVVLPLYFVNITWIDFASPDLFLFSFLCFFYLFYFRSYFWNIYIVSPFLICINFLDRLYMKINLYILGFIKLLQARLVAVSLIKFFFKNFRDFNVIYEELKYVFKDFFRERGSIFVYQLFRYLYTFWSLIPSNSLIRIGYPRFYKKVLSLLLFFLKRCKWHLRFIQIFQFK